MKTIFVLLLCFLAAQSAENPRLSANVNKFVDVLLGQVKKWIINHGMDPMKMEDITKTFQVKPIIITYHAELYLTNGWLQGIGDMKRDGNAQVSYEAMFLNLKLPILFPTLTVDYDYNVEVMGLLKHGGGLEARINNLHLYVDIVFDTKKFEIALQEFKITDAGKIEVKFSGNPLIDWLANILSKIVTTLLHDMVQRKIETEVRSALEAVINNVNAKLHPHQLLTDIIDNTVYSYDYDYVY